MRDSREMVQGVVSVASCVVQVRAGAGILDDAGYATEAVDVGLALIASLIGVWRCTIWPIEQATSSWVGYVWNLLQMYFSFTDGNEKRSRSIADVKIC